MLRISRRIEPTTATRRSLARGAKDVRRHRRWGSGFATVRGVAEARVVAGEQEAEAQRRAPRLLSGLRPLARVSSSWLRALALVEEPAGVGDALLVLGRDRDVR